MTIKHSFNGLSLFLSAMTKIAVLSCLFLPIASIAEPEETVILVPSSNSKIYTRTINSIRSSINIIAGNHITLKVLTLEEISRKGPPLLTTKGLIVPIGQHAFKGILRNSNSSPVLATLISLYSYYEILSGFAKHEESRKIGAIYIDQPIIREIRFARLLFPGNKKLGFLVSRKNMKYLDILNKLPRNNNHFIEVVDPNDNIISRLMETLDNSDVLVSLPDPLIFNRRTARSILLSSYRKRKPVIGFSSAYVKAGALAGIFSTPEQIGKQTAEVIYHFIQNDNSKWLHTYDAKYFSVKINSNVARSFGIKIPNPIIIEHKLKRMESDLD